MDHQPFGLVPSLWFDLPPEPQTLLSLNCCRFGLSQRKHTELGCPLCCCRLSGRQGITLRTCPEDFRKTRPKVSSPLPCECSPSLLCAHSLGARMARMPRRPILNVRMPCVFQVQTFIPLMAEETIRRGLRASRRAGEHIPPDHPQKHDSCLLIRLSAACYGCLGRNLGVLLQPACCAVCVG